MILYEYPFNERIRTYLRLEQLFKRLALLVDREHSLDHHYAIATIFEVMDVASRADLKSDVLKDIEKQKHALNSYRGNPSISESALNAMFSRLELCFSVLNAQAGKAGQTLTDNEWLMAIRSRIGIPGGTCGFDLPGYAAWQHRPAAVRQQHLGDWAGALAPLADGILLLLQLLRESGAPQKVVAEQGQLQQTLPPGRTFQLARLRLDSALGVVPEISGNRLMLSVRLMHMQPGEHASASTQTASFELTLCS